MKCLERVHLLLLLARHTGRSMHEATLTQGSMTVTRKRSLSWKPCGPPCKQDEGGLVEELAAEEDDMDGGLHDALALMQKWDGRGTFRGERASATSGRVEALLTKYQFEFDDESIDFELIECLMRYICRSAYEDGAVLVFLPGWDDITRCGKKIEFGGTPELMRCPVVRVSGQCKCIRALELYI